jgi:hypothetical protein
MVQRPLRSILVVNCPLFGSLEPLRALAHVTILEQVERPLFKHQVRQAIKQTGGFDALLFMRRQGQQPEDPAAALHTTWLTMVAQRRPQSSPRSIRSTRTSLTTSSAPASASSRVGALALTGSTSTTCHQEAYVRLEPRTKRLASS